jgi:beta-phosphoglucomutase
MIRGVIFDLDGVLVTTDELHYQSWQIVADAEGIPFNRAINDRLRGVSRIESLAIVLERSPRSYTHTEKQALADRKNFAYQQLLKKMTSAALLPGALAMLAELRRRAIKLAVGSSSRNTPLILAQLNLTGLFDAVADGNEIAKSKPDPEVFLLAARKLGLPPAECLVVEDAVAGVEAARRAGMRVLGIGSPAKLPGVARVAPDLSHLTADQLLAIE